MIALFSDTHSDRGHELTGAAREAAEAASVVVHAGDFTSVAALEAFREVSERLVAVHGNVDGPVVRERLPDRTVTDAEGIRIAVVHRPEGGEAGLAAYGRSEGADVVVFGHTHQPTIVETGGPVLCNPGSHAQPRGNRPGFGRLERDGDVLELELCEPDGTSITSLHGGRIGGE